MNHLTRLIAVALIAPICSTAQRTEVMLLASDHFSQVYKPGNPNTDILTPLRQAEMARVVTRIAAFRPQLVLVERQPASNATLDSLYHLFREGALDPASLPDGRDEVYQIAFKVAKRARVAHVYGTNAPGGSSQSMLANGDNIGIYQDSTASIKALVRDQYAAIGTGSLSFRDYIRFLNAPETYNKIYRLRYVTPLRVMNGTFENPDEMVDTAFIINRYIGAELTAIFKRRDYMIYSNLVNYAMQENPRRILLVIGTAHIGSLRSILRDDPEFRLVDPLPYLRETPVPR